MNTQSQSAALAARIYSSFPVAQSAFSKLLDLLEIEAAPTVPTAAVTLGGRSRLLINPDFVARNCPADHDLVMLVLHELHHVALGHTRLFPRLTRAENWAFDCVINAQLCRLYPEPHHTALFRRSYRADSMPEALLRPPEGWRTPRERWLRGRAGDIHRELYSETGVTYADLYRLLPSLAQSGRTEAGDGFAAGRLLGNHADGDNPSSIEPDLLRELRNILSEWPMVERLSGRDQGGAADTLTVARSEARRGTAATLRRAILAVADLGHVYRGAIGRRDEAREGILPYVLRLQRRAFVQGAVGVSPLLHPAEISLSGISRREQVHVYLDVSGSMDAALPALYATMTRLSSLLHPKIHLFSTRIDDIDLRQLACGVRRTTGGTDITPVTQHALDNRITRALFVTDGWVGEVPDEHSRELARRGTRFAVAVTCDGDTTFAAALGAKAWPLPNLEESA